MVRIPFADGTLEGALDVPPQWGGASGATAVVVCHPHPGFGGRMDNELIVALARGFADAGIAALRFHYRGIEGSDGRATGGLVEEEDVLAAVDYLLGAGAARVAVVGYSFGALMAVKAIAAGARPPAFVGVAMPTSLIDGHAERLAAMERAMASGVPIGLLAGDRDPLCDLTLLGRFSAGRATVEVLAGEAHVLTQAGTRIVVRRAVELVQAGLA
jgi:alpha/beta superfamily hydrolase